MYIYTLMQCKYIFIVMYHFQRQRNTGQRRSCPHFLLLLHRNWILPYKLILLSLCGTPRTNCLPLPLPSKNTLAKSCKKRSFFLHPCKILQDLARSCRILRNLVRFCRNRAGILQEFRARILQDSCKSCRGARKKDLFLQDLARAFLLGYFVGFIT